MLQLWQKVNTWLLVPENETLFFQKERKLICLCLLLVLYGILYLLSTSYCWQAIYIYKDVCGSLS